MTSPPYTHTHTHIARVSNILKINLCYFSNNDILLEIKLHIPGTRAYLPSSELIWNTTNSTTPDSLRHAIASHLSLPADRLIMAKYYPSKYDWIILEDESQHKVSTDHGNVVYC